MSEGFQDPEQLYEDEDYDEEGVAVARDVKDSEKSSPLDSEDYYDTHLVSLGCTEAAKDL